jgi:hypothetical protein
MKQGLDRMMKIIVTITVLEIIFGVNGRLLIIGRIPIRYILFGLITVGAYSKFLAVFICNYRFQKRKFFSFLKIELKLFKLFDLILLIFLFMNLIWIFLIPTLSGSSVHEAVSNVRYLVLMVLYFPVVYLIRQEKIVWSYYRKMVFFGVCLIIGLHVFLFIGESIQKVLDPSTHFAERLVVAWSRLVNGHCYFSPVLMPKYSVRIIYTFGYLLFLGFYFVLNAKSRLFIVIYSSVTMLALLTTGTRTLIIAPFIGLIVFYLCKNFIQKKPLLQRSNIGYLLFLFIIMLLFDLTFFGNRTAIRLLNSYQVSSNVLESGKMYNITYENTDYTIDKEIAGTVNSNTSRVLQIKSIIESFKERPLFGFGYGSMGLTDTREVAYYDMQGATLLMRGGLVGSGMWLAYIIYICVYMLRQGRAGNTHCYSFVFIIASVFFSAQLCGTLQTMTMLMILYCYLDCDYEITRLQKELII